MIGSGIQKIMDDMKRDVGEAFINARDKGILTRLTPVRARNRVTGDWIWARLSSHTASNTIDVFRIDVYGEDELDKYDCWLVEEGVMPGCVFFPVRQLKDLVSVFS